MAVNFELSFLIVTRLFNNIDFTTKGDKRQRNINFLSINKKDPLNVREHGNVLKLFSRMFGFIGFTDTKNYDSPVKYLHSEYFIFLSSLFFLQPKQSQYNDSGTYEIEVHASNVHNCTTENIMLFVDQPVQVGNPIYEQVSTGREL